MRIRRENKGKDIIVNCAIEIEKPKDHDAKSDELQIAKLMETYGIPTGIEMMTRLIRCVMKDLQMSSANSTVYRFTLIGQRD